MPEAINESSISLEGVSEAGATVYVFLNEKKSEVVAGESGGFNLRVFLLDGENTIYAQAKDAAGNEGQKTQVHTIIFDDEPPALNISNPADGTQFSGSKNQKVSIQGTAEAEASLTINQRFVSIRDDGTFSFDVTLAEGDNSFIILTEDAAGNQTEKNLTLKYSP